MGHGDIVIWVLMIPSSPTLTTKKLTLARHTLDVFEKSTISRTKFVDTSSEYIFDKTIVSKNNMCTLRPSHILAIVRIYVLTQ